MRIQPHQDLETTVQMENAPPGLKLDQIQGRYGQIKDELEAGGVDSLAYTIKKIFANQLSNSRVPKKMRGCLCVNFGSFTSPKYGEVCKQKNRPMFHLAAFEIFKQTLDDYLDEPIRSRSVLFHDPEMNEEDENFLRMTPEYSVIPNVVLEVLVHRDVFVYAPCATFDWIVKLIGQGLPSVFVGVDCHDWPEALSPKPEYDDEKNRRLAADLQNVKKICRERLGAYVCVRLSQKYLVMKEDYKFPKVTAYCALGST